MRTSLEILRLTFALISCSIALNCKDDQGFSDSRAHFCFSIF